MQLWIIAVICNWKLICHIQLVTVKRLQSASFQCDFFFLSLSIFYHWNGNWTCTTMIERIHSSTMQEGNGSNNNILLMSERGSDSQCILTSQTNIKYRPFIYAFESCLMNFIDLLPQHSLFLSAKLRRIKYLHTHTHNSKRRGQVILDFCFESSEKL